MDIDYKKINQDSWDARVETHVKSEFYNINGFLSGDSSLNDIELSELGCVKDKSLLHLQCHFGLDTLSWARMGAKVTGVDLSPEAIKKANELTQKANLQAEFICSDVLAFANHPSQEYDIVYTSYGAICWLPDLNLWAQTIASKLKVGGVFYMAEFHPIYDLVAGYRYFHDAAPDIEEEGTYTENCSGEKSTFILWAHPISDVINALIKVGITIEAFNEYAYSPYNCFDNMVERQKGQFCIEYKGYDIPLIYTIRGKKR